MKKTTPSDGDSDRSFCFISINKFGSFKNTFSMITCQSEFHFT